MKVQTLPLPLAFTQEGVAMLSSVLRSPRAIQVNIEIMRAFVRLRGFAASHKYLMRKLAAVITRKIRAEAGCLSAGFAKQVAAAVAAELVESFTITEPKR